MNVKIVLLMVLAASFLMFGCAGKKAAPAAESQGEMTAPDGAAAEDDADTEADTTGPGENRTPDSEPSEEPPADTSGDEALADMFRIDTDKPIADEGLDVSTPSSD